MVSPLPTREMLAPVDWAIAGPIMNVRDGLTMYRSQGVVMVDDRSADRAFDKVVRITDIVANARILSPAYHRLPSD